MPKFKIKLDSEGYLTTYVITDFSQGSAEADAIIRFESEFGESPDFVEATEVKERLYA